MNTITLTLTDDQAALVMASLNAFEQKLSNYTPDAIEGVPADLRQAAARLDIERADRALDGMYLMLEEASRDAAFQEIATSIA